MYMPRGRPLTDIDRQIIATGTANVSQKFGMIKKYGKGVEGTDEGVL